MGLGRPGWGTMLQTEQGLPPAATAWPCPTCGCEVTTPFCPGCGERPLRPQDLTLRGLIRQAIRVFVKIDGKVINSCRALAFRPGALTRAYSNGQRKPYLKPIQLFILTNVLFFAVQSYSALHVFSTQLEAQVTDESWSDLARLLVDRRLARTGSTFEALAAVYDKAVAVNAKSLIGLMVLPLAACLALIFRGAARPFAVHIVFSLHFYAFLLLLFCVPAALAALEALAGGSIMLTGLADDITSAVLLITCATYLYIAINKVYDTRGIGRILQASALVVAIAAIFLAYRLLLLPITLYTI